MRAFLLSIILTAPVSAQVNQSTPGWFPFPISALDDSPASLDLSGLNEKPAGKSGFVAIKGESFVDGAGQPIRFFGVNVVAGGCFPDRAQAPRIAGHLAKMGVNIVRFHFLDNHWGGLSLLKKPDYQEFDPEAFERWDFFVAELKKHGIYSNINLHVGRIYPGTPKDAPDFSKGLDNFYPPFVQALKDYSRHLLEHVNPHTKLAYKDDPAVACIEVNNENTLIMNPWWLNRMPEPFQGEITARWNAWLKRNFANDEVLIAAFGLNDGKTGENLLTNGDFKKNLDTWKLELGDPSKSTASVVATGLQWKILQVGDKQWSHQLNCEPLPVTEGGRYRLKFRCRRPEGPAKASVAVRLAEDPWTSCGLQAEFEPQAEWKDFSFDFSPAGTRPNKVRLTFSALNTVGTLELAAVQVFTVPEGFLAPEHSLGKGNVPLPTPGANLKTRRAFFEFLAEVELSYAREIHTFLKKELGVRCPVAHSHVLFGGMLGARREFLAGDFVDTHGYWQHPWFPRKKWDLSDWLIENTPQTASKEGGTLAEMAMQRPEGKPYTVSEYDIPAPNDSSAETMPMFAAMACQQGWAAIYSFSYTLKESDWTTDKIAGFFTTVGHPAKEGFMPAAALLFRTGENYPTPNMTLEVGAPTLFADCAHHNGDIWGSWRRIWNPVGGTGLEAWTHRVKLRISENTIATRLTKDPAPEVQAAQFNAEAGTFLFDTAAHAILAGKLRTANWPAAQCAFTPSAAEATERGTLTISALDGKSLAASSKILITAASRAENQNMGWSADRKTVSNRWGDGPALVLGISGTIKLPPGKWSATTLDPKGAPKTPLGNSLSELTLKGSDQTIWYLLEREK